MTDIKHCDICGKRIPRQKVPGFFFNEIKIYKGAAPVVARFYFNYRGPDICYPCRVKLAQVIRREITKIRKQGHD